ncbi:MAG: ABC transporter substrate-binding protein [Lachnospiraceae bacterium]|nr:ABC transporter substrate-binding protein [Lachnospiraceae bacterium]
MKKRFLTAAMALALTAGGAGTAADAKEAPVYTVGICQYVRHEALDAAARGFKDAVTEGLGDKVEFNEQNAQGDAHTCPIIINSFVSGGVDLILANATPALQAAATATDEIPILGTSVTDYAAALDVDEFDGTAGRNVSGTSDLAPLDEQAAMVQELFPDAENVGLIYCSSEPNSLYQVKAMTGELEKRGYTCKAYGFSDSNDISAVVTRAASECDVLYVPTDNTAASNAELIANICVPAGIPVIAGEEGACRGCGVATLSIDYYSLGYTTGEMAVRVLAQGEDISAMPIEYAPAFTKKYNREICEKLGLEMPEDYEALEMIAD